MFLTPLGRKQDGITATLVQYYGCCLHLEVETAQEGPVESTAAREDGLYKQACASLFFLFVLSSCSALFLGTVADGSRQQRAYAPAMPAASVHSGAALRSIV